MAVSRIEIALLACVALKGHETFLLFAAENRRLFRGNVC